MTRTVRSVPSVLTRLPASRAMLGVFAGDMLVLFAFIATGQYAHEYYFWELPVHTLLVTLPFIIAWILVAPLAGLYSKQKIKQFHLVVPLVVGSWVVISLLGGFIRSTGFFPGGAPPAFLAVNVVFGTLFLLPWRLVVSWWLSSA